MSLPLPFQHRYCPIASLALAFGLSAWAQPNDTPLVAPVGRAWPEVKVTGLTDPAGAQIILINATGKHTTEDGVEHCSESRVLPLNLQMYDPKTGMARIGSQVDEGCWCRDPMAGLAVLAPNRAVAYFPNTRKRPNDPLLLCTNRSSFTVFMRRRREVDVRVWSPSGHLQTLARDEIVNADWIFSKELAGVTFTPMFDKENKDELANLNCENAAVSTHFQPGAINVYYGIGLENHTCNSGDIIFIHQVPVLGDLAHELGHALGLFQNDNQAPTKSDGHITGIDPFACDNVMWMHTQYLKNTLSAGQAFWMSQSCKSFLAFSGSCLSCSPEPDSPSPCPPFALGMRVGSCTAHVVAPGEKLLAPIFASLHKQLGDSGAPVADVPTSVYPTRKTLSAELSKRYNALKLHAHGHPELTLGSVSRAGFVFNWDPDFQVPVVPPRQPTAKPAKPGRTYPGAKIPPI